MLLKIFKLKFNKWNTKTELYGTYITYTTYKSDKYIDFVMGIFKIISIIILVELFILIVSYGMYVFSVTVEDIIPILTWFKGINIFCLFIIILGFIINMIVNLLK